MPIEDARRDGLRIGAWLESFPGRRALPGRPPLVTPPPPRVPVFRPLRPRDPHRRPVALPMADLARVESTHHVRLRVALTCLAATAVGTAAFAVLADRAGSAPALDQRAVADPVTLGAMPSPSTSSAAPAKPPPPVHPTATSTSPIARHAAVVPHHTTAPPAPPARPVVIGGLRVGDTVDLRVQVGYGSPARRRAAVVSVGSFVVRPAPGGGCVAFESAARPGYFLRHRDFVLHLDRADGSSLFRLDSAFCPVPAGDGSFRLRSANYPDRFLTAARTGFALLPVPAARATEFSIR
jgi:Alpha-L-arabinofuranosidase B (ABFB) domain